MADTTPTSTTTPPVPVKVRETMKTDPQGMSEVVHTLVRVRVLAEGEKAGKGMEVLPDSDNTPLSEWALQEGK